MANAYLATDPVMHFVDNNGNALVGGQLWTYLSGTNTPAATYTDSTGSVANTNPIILNARGECAVYFAPNQNYKLVLQDASSNTIWTADQQPGFSSSILAAYLAQLGGSNGSTQIGYNAGFTGAITRTVWSKLHDVISVVDATGVDPTGTTDSTIGIQAALNSGANVVYVPAGTYLISATLNIPAYVTLYGAGRGATMFYGPGLPANAPMLQNTQRNGVGTNTWLDSNIQVFGITFDGAGVTGRAAAGVALLEFYHCQEVYVYDCTLQNIKGSAIGTSCSNHVYLEENDIFNTGDSIGGYAFTADVVSGNSAVHTYIRRNNFNNLNWGAINFSPSAFGACEQNTIITCGESAIRSFPTLASSWSLPTSYAAIRICDNFVINTTMKVSRAHGIDIGGMGGFTVMGNHISLISGDGIALTDVQDSLIQNNFISGCGTDQTHFPNGSAIQINCTTPTASLATRNLRIANNHLGDMQASKTQAYGLSWQTQTNNSLMSGVIFEGNDCQYQRLAGWYLDPTYNQTLNQGIIYLNNNKDATGLYTSGQNHFNRNQLSVPYLLTSAATITMDCSQSNNFTLLLATNTTFAAPTNLYDGMIFHLSIQQDATGSRTAAWNAVFDWGSAGAPTLSTTPGTVDHFTFKFTATLGGSYNPQVGKLMSLANTGW